jgi:hypothetical protein
VRRYLPEKQRYTLELLEPTLGGGAGQRMDVRPANFVLAHLPAGTRCARAARVSMLPPRALLTAASPTGAESRHLALVTQGRGDRPARRGRWAGRQPLRQRD